MTKLVRLTRWLLAASEEHHAPIRLHLAHVEPDSILGSPEMSPEFLAIIASAATKTRRVVEVVTCAHHRMTGDDPIGCPDCAGDGEYLRERRVYVDPLAAAIEHLRRHPGAWPSHRPAAAVVVTTYLQAGCDVPLTAARLGMPEDEAHSLIAGAIASVIARYREEPTTRVNWTEKSESQRAAES